MGETGRFYVYPIAHYGQAYLDWRAAGGKLDHETTYHPIPQTPRSLSLPRLWTGIPVGLVSSTVRVHPRHPEDPGG